MKRWLDNAWLFFVGAWLLGPVFLDGFRRARRDRRAVDELARQAREGR